tara:strand:- start:117 stop:308 length:192 start_codon:yes stop_codon:yes gene_type:complete
MNVKETRVEQINQYAESKRMSIIVDADLAYVNILTPKGLRGVHLDEGSVARAISVIDHYSKGK